MITPRQEEVLEAIEGLIDRHGYPPTIRELGAELGLRSTSSVARLLMRLKTAGVVDWNPTQVRTLRVVHGDPKHTGRAS